jgi:hypothetical protein
MEPFEPPAASAAPAIRRHSMSPLSGARVKQAVAGPLHSFSVATAFNAASFYPSCFLFSVPWFVRFSFHAAISRQACFHRLIFSRSLLLMLSIGAVVCM